MHQVDTLKAMPHVFDQTRAIQAAAHIIKQHSGQITRIRLLKLLYITERECLQHHLTPLLSDRIVAMDHGPVLSGVYDLLKDASASSPHWNRFIRQIGPFTHQLVDDPGVGQLNRFEVDKLTEVCQRFAQLDDWHVAEATHEFEEWKKNKPDSGSSQCIPTEDVLRAVGRGDDVEELERKRKEDASVNRIFG